MLPNAQTRDVKRRGFIRVVEAIGIQAFVDVAVALGTLIGFLDIQEH